MSHSLAKEVIDRLVLAVHAGKYTLVEGAHEASKTIDGVFRGEIHKYSPTHIMQVVGAKVEAENAWNKLSDNDQEIANAIIDFYNGRLNNENKALIEKAVTTNNKAGVDAFVNLALRHLNPPRYPTSQTNLEGWALLRLKAHYLDKD